MGWTGASASAMGERVEGAGLWCACGESGPQSEGEWLRLYWAGSGCAKEELCWLGEPAREGGWSEGWHVVGLPVLEWF